MSTMFALKITQHDYFLKILKHLEKYHFLIPSNSGGYTFGPFAETVRENIINEWKRSNIIYRDKNVLFYPSRSNSTSNSFRSAFAAAKAVSSNLPFGLAEIKESTASLHQEPEILSQSQNETILKYVGFLHPTDGKQFFYRWQLQRKRWWRIFSTDPGRFSLTSSENTEKDEVSIICNFPWGEFKLETITYVGSSWTENMECVDPYQFSIISGRKRTMPHVIECSVHANLAVLLYLCDAFKVVEKKPTLCFHRKIAPYKYAFAVEPQEEEAVANDLGCMLCLEMRKRGLSSLWPVLVSKSLSSSLSMFDSIGIPYVIIIGPESVNSGVIGLRDRDTTLSEQVHISEMGDYGELIMKNYELKNF